MSMVHVRHVAKALEERFGDLIDMSDLDGQPEDKRRQMFLSRALSALAVQCEQPCTDKVAAQAVFDGPDDQGLDAIAVEDRPVHPRICLVQAKWSDQGKAGFGEAEVHKAIRGLELIFNLKFDKFNRRFQPHVQGLEQAFDHPLPRITLVLALMRSSPLSEGVISLLEEQIAEFNQVDEMVDYKVIDLREFHRAILGDAAAPKIDTRVRLEGFGQETSPYKAMYGTMTAPHIAELYDTHRRGLFARNIRDALDVSDVNVKIRNTLLEQPEHLWYFSNGVTVLCDSIRPVGKAVPGGVVEFEVTGMSVVNGAQTVSAIYKAYSLDPDAAQRGRVLVRVISLEDCPPGFGDHVTTSTNTQNPIEDRDFKSLDSVQLKLREDFVLALKLLYVIKRGEQPPEPEHGCSIVEAADALAAVNSDAQYAALAKRDPAALWRDETYGEIFGTAPNVYRVWRSVQLLRAVRAHLQICREGMLGRAGAMAGYGDLLITHVVFRQLKTHAIENLETDWDSELIDVPKLVEDALAWSLRAVDAEYGPNSQVFTAVRNTERISRVARSAIRGMAAGHPAPDLTLELMSAAEPKGRQVDAVRTLVNAARIADGTALEFRPMSRPERREMTDWLAEDPSRSRAVWRNDHRRPLQWQADMKWYSPSGLVRMMRKEASGKDQAAQGTLHWHIPDQGSLKEIAEAVRAEQGFDVEDEQSEPDDL